MKIEIQHTMMAKTKKKHSDRTPGNLSSFFFKIVEYKNNLVTKANRKLNKLHLKFS